MLYGAGDFGRGILLAVNGGYDTDCTAATVGATLGLLLGTEGIAQRWIEPIGEGVFIGPGILGIDAPKTLTELTARTVAQIGKLEPEAWDGSIWEQPLPTVDLAKLPGTITVHPRMQEDGVLWANGELPDSVKQAGGAIWTWEVTADEPREILCLASEGARLFLNEQLILECPPGLPYVPAPHRCSPRARVQVTPGVGTHRVRVELNSRDPGQVASIILTYPNFHLCPWTKEELLLPATLLV